MDAIIKPVYTGPIRFISFQKLLPIYFLSLESEQLGTKAYLSFNHLLILRHAHTVFAYFWFQLKKRTKKGTHVHQTECTASTNNAMLLKSWMEPDTNDWWMRCSMTKKKKDISSLSSINRWCFWFWSLPLNISSQPRQWRSLEWLELSGGSFLPVIKINIWM